MRVQNSTVKREIADRIISRIKKRKGLENADDDIVAGKVKYFLSHNKRALQKLSKAEDFSQIERSRELKALIKHVRAELRTVYGIFIDKSLASVKDDLEKGKVREKKALSSHRSSKERMGFYRDFYRRIFSITGKPFSIIDIAAGMNPFSFPYMGIGSGVYYIALELNQNDADLIQKYFDAASIKGNALKHDIKEKPIRYRADIAFAFKIFDMLDSKIAERIIKELNVKWIAASFSTKTVSKKDMKAKRRAGFQKMLRRLGMEYKTLEFPNEIVYVIKK